MGRIGHELDVGTELALKNLPHKSQPSIVFSVAQAVTHKASVEGSAQLWHEIAHLVGMAEDHKPRPSLSYDLAQGLGVSVWGVLAELRGADVENLVEFSRGEFGRQTRPIAGEDEGRHRQTEISAEVLTSRDSFPGRPQDFSCLMFGENKHFVRHC